MRQFGQRTRGVEWFHQAEQNLRLRSDDQELFENWYSKLLYYHYGQPSLFESFLATGPTLTSQEKTLVWALRQVRLSIFTIVDVRRGHSVLMEDLLFGGRAWVLESTLAEPDMLQAVLLARLAAFGEEILLMGMYIRPMAEWKARLIVEELRERAGSTLSPQELCQTELATWLSQRFRLGLQELDQSTLPMLVTPEGEPLCQVVDRYPFNASEAIALRRALSEFPELCWEDPHNARWMVATSELGRIVLQKNALVLKCKSLGRADRLGESLRKLPSLKNPRRSQQAPLSEDEIHNSYREWARRWPDTAIPALGGRTPRQAVSIPDGRNQVAALLLEFECYLASLPPAQSISLAELRHQLGLPNA